MTKIIDIFAKKKANENEEKINFESANLESLVGAWLGFLDKLETTNLKASLVKARTYSIKNGKDKWLVKKELSNLIRAEFLKLLNQVDLNDSYYLDLAHKDGYGFSCVLKSEKETFNLYFRWGDLFEEPAQLHIDNGVRKDIYDYYNERKKKLSLNYRINRNLSNNNLLQRFYSPFEVEYTLSNGDYRVVIEVRNPNKLDILDNSLPVFYLDKEEELREHLQGITFPVSLLDVYNELKGICGVSVLRYPNFEVKIKKKVGYNRWETTDELTIKKGILTNLVMSMNDNNISITNDNWTIKTKKEIITCNQKNKTMSYTLRDVSTDSLDSDVIDLEKIYMKNKEKAEFIRKLIMNNKKK